MLKTLSTIFLSMLCFASLCVGIMFSACPVIPYVTYRITSSRFGAPEALIFSPTNTAKSYDIESGSTNLTLSGSNTYACDENKIFFGTSNYNSYSTVSRNKKELTAHVPLSTATYTYKANFNPTFIFYLVSAGALAGIIFINIPKKKKYE